MLSTTSKYAIRALVELAQTAEGERVLGQDLATRAGLPANYLSKILASLSKAGLVAGSRGSGGGYRLRRRPAELSLLEIVELLDGSQRVSECLLRPGQACSATDPCTAHREWSRLRERCVEYLASTTIEGLSRPVEAAAGTFGGSEIEDNVKPEEERD